MKPLKRIDQSKQVGWKPEFLGLAVAALGAILVWGFGVTNTAFQYFLVTGPAQSTKVYDAYSSTYANFRIRASRYKVMLDFDKDVLNDSERRSSLIDAIDDRYSGHAKLDDRLRQQIDSELRSISHQEGVVDGFAIGTHDETYDEAILVNQYLGAVEAYLRAAQDDREMSRNSQHVYRESENVLRKPTAWRSHTKLLEISLDKEDREVEERGSSTKAQLKDILHNQIYSAIWLLGFQTTILYGIGQLAKVFSRRERSDKARGV